MSEKKKDSIASLQNDKEKRQAKARERTGGGREKGRAGARKRTGGGKEKDETASKKGSEKTGKKQKTRY